MINKTNINNSSIESAGLPKDYKEAISELIWNGFDAKATSVKISFEANELDHITNLVVSDNGEGIAFEDLTETFGSFWIHLKETPIKDRPLIEVKKEKAGFLSQRLQPWPLGIQFMNMLENE